MQDQTGGRVDAIVGLFPHGLLRSASADNTLLVTLAFAYQRPARRSRLLPAAITLTMQV